MHYGSSSLSILFTAVFIFGFSDVFADECGSEFPVTLGQSQQINLLLRASDLRDRSTKDSIREYFKFQYPERSDPSVGNTLRSCQSEELQGHPAKTDGQGNVLDSCLPDTLYSWGSLEKIRWLESKMGKGAWDIKNFKGYIATVAFPTGSFAYGPFAIRIKLKQDVKYLPSLNRVITCESLTEAEKKNTVIVIVSMAGKNRSGMEEVLCSPGPIHSWSYGTRQHYDEMIKDAKWILDPSHKNDFHSYVRVMNPETGHFEPSYFGVRIDGKEFTEETLKLNLKNHLELIEKKNSQIYINPDFRSDMRRATNDHFRSKWTIYFHDNQPQ